MDVSLAVGAVRTDRTGLTGCASIKTRVMGNHFIAMMHRTIWRYIHYIHYFFIINQKSSGMGTSLADEGWLYDLYPLATWLRQIAAGIGVWPLAKPPHNDKLPRRGGLG